VKSSGAPIDSRDAHARANCCHRRRRRRLRRPLLATKLGWSDVVLVERADLTSGSTFHSAGLVGQLRGSLSLTRMMMSSVELYRTLEAEVGLETGWREVGSLRLASSEERMEELARQAGWAKTFGLPLDLISPREAQELFPPMSTDGVLGAAYLPTDGYIDPSQLTFALAEGARRGGAEDRNPDARHRNPGRAGPRDRRRDGQGGDRDGDRRRRRGHLRRRGRAARRRERPGHPDGARVPRHASCGGSPGRADHARSLVARLLPGRVGRAGDGRLRAEPAPWALDGIAPDFNGKLLAEDWPRFEELMENALVRVPGLADMEVVRLINGPEAFTPDGEFIIGPSDVGGFWVAAGFCAHGLAGAGGMGKALVAEWIVEGVPSLDVWEMDSRRFGRHYRSRDYTLARTVEIYSTYYDVKYPGHERTAGRPLRLSPVYGRLQELGAAFGEKSGWERANWFEPNGDHGDESLRPRGWAGRLWSPAIGAEHLACRESAALFDETSFAKIEIAGEGAATFLERLCDNRVARDVGAITYTQMLNPNGGIECDFTVTRLEDDRFRIVTGTAFGQHDLAWIPRARARRRLGDRRRRDVEVRVPRPLGPTRARRARTADDRRPLLSLYASARDRGRPGPVPRAARDVRRRAGLGVLLWDGVRSAPLGRHLGGGPQPRSRRRRLQGDRLAPSGEGLQGLGQRHHAG
jgi:4-methylaminobutanoate oxidase (formaldehyde-forming)